jgi:hypothetical protein
MKRTTLVSGLVLGLSFIPVSAVMAVNSGTPVARISDTPVAPPTPTSSPVATSSNAKSVSSLANHKVFASNAPTPLPVAPIVAKADLSAHLASLKNHGSTEISRRLSSLQASIASLNATTKLSASDKAILTGQLQSELSSLGALNTKLSADGSLPDARTDVQSVFANYRVYALMLPKTRLVAAADALSSLGDKFNTLAHSLQDKINSAKTSGTDVASSQAALTDLEAKLDDARTKYTGLATTLAALQPSDYNADRTVLTGYRDDLFTARADFTAARADVTTVITGLDQTAKTMPSPHVTP